MSKAQVEFMREHLPAYLAWLKATGSAVGIKIQPWQERIVQALIRNGHMNVDGSVTERGKKSFDRRMSVIVPRPYMSEGLTGKTGDLVIIDDTVETNA